MSNTPPSLATLARLLCGLLWLSSCGGNTQSNPSGAQDDGASPEAIAVDATELIRALPERCDRTLDVPCATSADHDACSHNARRLVESAQTADCMPQVRAALDCVEQERADCNADGKARSPAACAALLDELNSCINGASDWSDVGCSALNEPNPDGGPDACDVTCGNLSANCRSEGGELHCVCTRGASSDRRFNTPECPDVAALAQACSFRDVL